MNPPAVDEPGDDSELIAEYLRSGDHSAFRKLVERHQERAFRLAVSILGPGAEAEAEEVVQEAFLKVYRSLPRFRMQSTFGTWLYRIASNCAFDARKRRGARQAAPGEAAELASPDASSPLARAMGGERRRILTECITRLPEMYQVVLRLHYWHGLSVDEIAMQLSAAPNTIKSYLLRARERLARLLAGRGVTHV